MLVPEDTPQKQCTICKKFLPANPDHFYSNKISKDGFASQCRPCKKIYDKQYYEANKKRLCERGKLYYQKNIDRGRETRRNYQQNHKSDKIEYDKQYRLDRKERLKEIKSVYYQNNKALFKEKGRLYTLSHKEEHRKRVKKYKHSPLGRVTGRASDHKRRARKLAAGGSYTSQQLQEQKIRQKSKCYWCHAELGMGRNAYHADHVIPLTRGGSNDISNIVITCPTCNLKKGNKLPHEWGEGGRLL